MGIVKEIIARTVGENDDVAQVFTQNAIVDVPIEKTKVFAFEVPLYTIQGATFDFYNQTTEGISTDLNNIKKITYTFLSGSTSLINNIISSSASTIMVHDMYRLNYDIFTAFVERPIGSTGTTEFDNVNDALSNVLIIFEEPISAFTSISEHVTSFPQKAKPPGKFTQDLFEDKSQYFLDTRFRFEKPFDLTLGDYKYFDSGNTIISISANTGTTEILETSKFKHKITGGTFSEFFVNGSYFTYFKAPNKPDTKVVNNNFSVIGNLPTFSPIFSFKGVNDGDFYKLQVSYDIINSAFTGSTTIFKIQKQIGDAEFIRTYSTPLTPNVNFIYRIGNVKEIVNVFGIKQNVTTWGDIAKAATANDGKFKLKGHVYRGIEGGPPISGASISITIQSTSSSVDLGADSTQDPNVSSEISNPLGGSIGGVTTLLTDINGFYDFGPINGGTYTFIVKALPESLFPPTSFPTQTFTITLNSDTNVDFVFSLIWGDEIILLGSESYIFL